MVHGSVADYTESTDAATEAVQLLFRARAKGIDPTGIVWVNDFEFEEGETVDFLQVWREKAGLLTPYALDDSRRRMIFVEIPLESSLTKSTKEANFFYQLQRVSTCGMYAVPYDIVNQVASEQAGNEALENSIMLYSTGRCGSTLFSKVLDSTGCGVQSLSEPDVYTQMVFQLGYAERHSPAVAAARRAEGVQLLRSYTQLLVQAMRRREPERPHVCIKFRSQVSMILPEMKEALPEAKHVFLYRNCIDVTDSFCCAFFSSWAMRIAHRLRLGHWLMSHHPLAPVFPIISPLEYDERYDLKLKKKLGIVGGVALMWLAVLDRAAAFQSGGGADADGSAGFNAVFRYEDLVSDRVGITAAVLRACGLTEAAASAAATATGGAGEGATDIQRVFDEDAHKDTALASKRRGGEGDSKAPQFILPADFEALKQLLEFHPFIKDGYYEIDGTLKVAVAAADDDDEDGTTTGGGSISSSSDIKLAIS